MARGHKRIAPAGVKPARRSSRYAGLASARTSASAAVEPAQDPTPRARQRGAGSSACTRAGRASRSVAPTSRFERGDLRDPQRV